MLGPPDRVTEKLLQWVICSGPPMSCYVAHFLPTRDIASMQFFHVHPEVISVHVVIAGSGEFVLDGIAHPVSAGSVVTIGAGVPHSVYPLREQPLTYIAVQSPGTGYAAGQWKVVPEAGTATHPGDPAAFVTQFGDPMQLFALATTQALFESDRWRAFVGKPSGR